MQYYHNIFHGIIQPEPLFRAWEEFKQGKSKRTDVLDFEQEVERHIFTLHRELRSRSYKHGPYYAFTICDPKQRLIHKATVRDRVVHHAVFAALNPLFEPSFFAHSYSCRKGKGTHRAMKTLHTWLRQVSGNGHKSCYVLQCDIHRFFESIPHAVLLDIMARRVKDKDVLWLLEEIIRGFASNRLTPVGPAGVPIGNLTSQLFANVYLNELDQFIKHELKIPHYARYTDDFAIVAESSEKLEYLINPIRSFLQQKLFLDLHPRKVTIRTYAQGIDFLGYVLLPYHRVVRTRTRHRMYRKLREKIILHRAGGLSEEGIEHSLQSYLGLLSHADAHCLSQEIQNQCWFWMTE